MKDVLQALRSLIIGKGDELLVEGDIFLCIRLPNAPKTTETQLALTASVEETPAKARAAQLGLRVTPGKISRLPKTMLTVWAKHHGEIANLPPHKPSMSDKIGILHMMGDAELPDGRYLIPWEVLRQMNRDDTLVTARVFGAGNVLDGVSRFAGDERQQVWDAIVTAAEEMNKPTEV